MSKVTKAFYQENPMSVLGFICLSIVTLGFYTVLYHYQLVESLKRNGVEGHEDLRRKWNFYAIGCAAGVVSYFLQFIFLEMEVWSLYTMFSFVFYIAALGSSIMMIVFAFQAARVIKEYTEEKYDIMASVSGVVLFLFPGVALCMLINHIKDSADYYGTKQEQAEA